MTGMFYTQILTLHMVETVLPKVKLGLYSKNEASRSMAGQKQIKEFLTSTKSGAHLGLQSG